MCSVYGYLGSWRCISLVPVLWLPLHWCWIQLPNVRSTRHWLPQISLETHQLRASKVLDFLLFFHHCFSSLAHSHDLWFLRLHCRFNGLEFLLRMKGKTVMFVGDSLGRNQWESLVCMISTAVPRSPTQIIRGDPLSTLKFLVGIGS